MNKQLDWAGVDNKSSFLNMTAPWYNDVKSYTEIQQQQSVVYLVGCLKQRIHGRYYEYVYNACVCCKGNGRCYIIIPNIFSHTHISNN